MLPCRTSGPVVSDRETFPENAETYCVKSSSSSTLAPSLNLLHNTLLAEETTAVDCPPVHLLCFAHKEAPRPTVDPDSETQGFKSWRSLGNSRVWTLKMLFYRPEAEQTFPHLHFYSLFPKPYGRSCYQPNQANTPSQPVTSNGFNHLFSQQLFIEQPCASATVQGAGNAAMNKAVWSICLCVCVLEGREGKRQSTK